MSNEELQEEIRMLKEEINKLNHLVTELSNRVMNSERKIHRLGVK